MNSFLKSSLALLSTAFVAGCSFDPKVPTDDRPYTGFMEDYRPLSQTEAKEMGLVSSKSWIAPGSNLANYTSVVIDPVQMGHGIQRDRQITSVELAKIRQYTEKTLHDKLSGYYMISDQAGPDTLQVRVAITGVETHDEALRLYEYLPIGIAISLGSKIIGVRDEEVNMFMEAEFVDGESGDVLAKTVSGMVAPERLENKWREVTLSVIKPALDQWINQQVAQVTVPVQPSAMPVEQIVAADDSTMDVENIE